MFIYAKFTFISIFIYLFKNCQSATSWEKVLAETKCDKNGNLDTSKVNVDKYEESMIHEYTNRGFDNMMTLVPPFITDYFSKLTKNSLM
jgi:hypothetical protein